jgi:hypothetical protein
LVKRKRRLKKKRKRNRNRKRKRKKEILPPLGWAGSGPTPSLYLARPFPARPTQPISRATAAPPLPLIGRPHPSAAPTLAPSRPPSLWQTGPSCQPLLPLVRDQAIGAFAAAHRPPRRLAINALTSSVWRLAPPRTVPEPSLHPRLPEPSRCHCVPSSPPWQARRCSPPLLPFPPRPLIKGPPRAPYFTTPGLSRSTSLPPSNPIKLDAGVPPLSGELRSPLSGGLWSNCFSS